MQFIFSTNINLPTAHKRTFFNIYIMIVTKLQLSFSTEKESKKTLDTLASSLK